MSRVTTQRTRRFSIARASPISRAANPEEFETRTITVTYEPPEHLQPRQTVSSVGGQSGSRPHRFAWLGSAHVKSVPPARILGNQQGPGAPPASLDTYSLHIIPVQIQQIIEHEDSC
jgi:hypothetical protein